jgi:hypothetical protein
MHFCKNDLAPPSLPFSATIPACPQQQQQQEQQQ